MQHQERRFRHSREVVAARMLAVAGDLDRHIVMPATGPHKYLTVHSAVDRDLIERHLAGEITIGSELRWADGATWSVCWDADNARDWGVLLAAARGLQASGAQPVLERSPSKGKHHGGGHLWLFFPGSVEPRAARATAEKHAPELRGLREFWPRAQSVRLPARYYRREPYAAWCPMARYGEGELDWRVGWDAADLLVSVQTPSGWVTEPALVEDARATTPSGPTAPLDRRPVDAAAHRPPPAAWNDPRWLARYGVARDSLPWAITEKQAIRWFNDTYDVRELLPKEGNGYARAAWRADDTPSIGYLPGNRWTDYGAGGRREDGRYGGGDAFEAFALLRHGIGGRDRALAEVVKRMIGEADRDLRRAARARSGVPSWVAEVMSPAAWRRYERLRAVERASSPDDVGECRLGSSNTELTGQRCL